MTTSHRSNNRPIIHRTTFPPIFLSTHRSQSCGSSGGARSDGWRRGGVSRRTASSSSDSSPAVVRGGFGAVVHREHSTSLYTRARVPPRSSRLCVARPLVLPRHVTPFSVLRRLSSTSLIFLASRPDLSVVSVHADQGTATCPKRADFVPRS